MKILFGLILSLIIGGQAWATLTANNVPVTKTGGSAPTLQNSDITDVVGVSVTSGVVTYVPQLCLNNVCETAWPSGGSQTTGSNLLFGNGSGGYTNVTGTSTTGSFVTFPVNSFNSSGLNWTSNYNYGSSTSAIIKSVNLITAFGQLSSVSSSTGTTVTNLNFTSTATYVCSASEGDQAAVQITIMSASSVFFKPVTNSSTVNWFCTGY